jgi:hypothetical protein
MKFPAGQQRREQRAERPAKEAEIAAEEEKDPQEEGKADEDKEEGEIEEDKPSRTPRQEPLKKKSTEERLREKLREAVLPRDALQPPGDLGQALVAEYGRDVKEKDSLTPEHITLITAAWPVHMQPHDFRARGL